MRRPLKPGPSVSSDAASDGPLRLLVLANKPPGLAPGQRFRFEQWAPRLERDHQIRLDLLPFESPPLTEILYRPGHLLRKAALVARDFLRRARAVKKARDYDAVVIFREASLFGPALYERMISRTGTPIIFDFDDSVWSAAQAAHNGMFSSLHFFGKTATLCRIATACTPGNEFLAAYARARNPNTFVIPTSIELDDYPVLPEPQSDTPFVVCWTGSTSTLAHFEHARPALERLAKEVPLVVKVICNKPPEREIHGAEMRFVPWTKEREALDIGDCHVGIMPLPDNEVTRGKCGLKALQYMATGRPVVISPVGVNCEIVENGRNGFLAETPEDYVSAMLQLARSKSLREQIGGAGRRTIEERYSAEVVSAKFAVVVGLAVGLRSQVRIRRWDEPVISGGRPDS